MKSFFILNSDPNNNLNAEPNDDLNIDSTYDNNNYVVANIVDNEDADDVQFAVTDPAPEDVGVDGSLEDKYPVEICQGQRNFVPNRANCSAFYDCTNKQGSSCPIGMWFDPNYTEDTLCQYPEVICAADNNICDCSESYPPLPLDPLIESQVTCLRDNRFHLFASTRSCGRYFICHNEMSYRMECRSGFHYNSKTEMCDYPEVVNCRIPDPDCPADGIKFLPDSTRCEVFYFCVHGFKTKQSCPFYHIWDIRTNSCQRQDQAICHLLE